MYLRLSIEDLREVALPDLPPYGALLVSRLATRLRHSGARGLSNTNIKQMRWAGPPTAPNLDARSFYEIEAARESWSVRQLERQIEAMLFERLALKGDAARLATEGQQISQPKDGSKTPSSSRSAMSAERRGTQRASEPRSRGG